MMHWEIQQGTDVSGPFSEDEILMMVEAGRIDADTMVRPEGKQAWKPATRHGRFAAALRAVAAAKGGAEEGSATTAGAGGDAGGGPVTARSRRAPIDGIPYKDPARWDQQTQLGMPVATLLPGGMPAVMPEAATGPGAVGTNGASTRNGHASGGAVGGPPPFPGAGLAAGGAGTAPGSATGSGAEGASSRGPSAPAGAASPVAVAVTSASAVRDARPLALAPAVARRAEGGVVSGLFDFGFTTLITARLARILYALHVIVVLAAFVVGCVLGVGAVQTALRLDSQTMLLAGVVQLVATPIVCLGALILGRVVAESVVVFFRVAEHLGEIDRKTQG